MNIRNAAITAKQLISPGENSGPAMKAGGGRLIRRIASIAAVVMALCALAIPRLYDDAGLYGVSLDASVMIMAFAFFASGVQAKWAFGVGSASIAVSLLLTYFFALPAAATGANLAWYPYVTGGLTVAFIGLATMGPKQPNIWY